MSFLTPGEQVVAVIRKTLDVKPFGEVVGCNQALTIRVELAFPRRPISLRAGEATTAHCNRPSASALHLTLSQDTCPCVLASINP